MRVEVFGVALLAMMLFLCAVASGNPMPAKTSTGNRVNGDTVDGGAKKKYHLDHTASKSPTQSTRGSPNPPLSIISHAIDDDFTTQIFQVKSEIQTGRVPGHYLRINGGKISADAARTNSKAQFRIHVYYDDLSNQDLWILESASEKGKVIAIANDKVIVKHVKIPFKSIVQVNGTHPEILLEKRPLGPGSAIFTLRLYHTSSSATKYYLGFDGSHGTVMVPSKVRPYQTEARFRII